MSSARSSLARRLVLQGAGIVLLALAGTGVLTAAALHVRAVQGLDAALLAAAHAHSGPTEWKVEDDVESPVEVRLAEPGDPMLDDADDDGPIWRDVGDRRVLMLPAEIEGRESDEHVTVVASAPRVTLAASAGPFLATYGIVAALSAVLAALVQAAAVRHAFAPIEAARKEADAVGLASGRRLTEGGPIEVAGFLSSINALLGRLEEAGRAQARFTDEAAHELRTPITVMLGELDVALRRERTPAEYREVLQSAREEVTHLRDMVEGLLGLARLDAGALPPPEPASAAAIAEAAARQERPAIEVAGATLAVDVRADATVPMHRALVVAAVANLLRNAAVHAPGAPVRLTVTAADGLRFEVDDEGPGVADADRDGVFDRLARGGEARRDRKGLGLGLSLAREVARRHGGDCVIEAAPGGGCRAVLTISSSGAAATARAGTWARAR